MWESIMAEVGSWFGGADIWGELSSAAGDVGDWLMASPDKDGVMSSNLMSAVESAIQGVGKLAAGSQLSHPHATSTAFHYQSNANPNQLMQSTAQYMRNDITGSGLRDAAKMKW